MFRPGAGGIVWYEFWQHKVLEVFVIVTNDWNFGLAITCSTANFTQSHLDNSPVHFLIQLVECTFTTCLIPCFVFFSQHSRLPWKYVNDKHSILLTHSLIHSSNEASFVNEMSSPNIWVFLNRHGSVAVNRILCQHMIFNWYEVNGSSFTRYLPFLFKSYSIVRMHKKVENLVFMNTEKIDNCLVTNKFDISPVLKGVEGSPISKYLKCVATWDKQFCSWQLSCQTIG